jgi:hypothetical protein
MEHLENRWTNFYKLILGSFTKICRKFRLWLRWDNNNGHFTWRRTSASLRASDWEGNPRAENSKPGNSKPTTQPRGGILRWCHHPAIPCPYIGHWSDRTLDVTSEFHKCDMSNYCEGARIVTLCVLFLTHYILFYLGRKVWRLSK